MIKAHKEKPMAKENPVFKIGDKVTWSSQSGGSTTTKSGEVAGIVPPRTYCNWHDLRGCNIDEKYKTLTRRFDGGLRNHESYIVMVKTGKTDKASPVLYWPRVSSLRLVE